MRPAIALLALLACSPTDPPTPAPTDLGPRPCTRDDECVVSCVRAGQCCRDLCQCSNVYHRDQLAAIEAANLAACGRHPVCPIAECAAPHTEHYAVCKAGACALETRSLRDGP